MHTTRRFPLSFLLTAGLAAACARATPLPVPARAQAPAEAAPDVAFMQGMIAHHAQALRMTRLIPGRSTAADVRLLGERIERSQRDEIGLMAAWLRARSQPVPDTAHVAMGHPGSRHLMQGMLTESQMLALEGARGEAFDRLFLERMIQHHRGALAMVQRLLAQPGGSRDPEAFRFASEVDADQRAEIARMERLLSARARRTAPSGANFGT